MAVSLREHDHFGAEALSAATVGNALVDRVYAKLTPFYDIIFGPILQPGRVATIARMGLKPGDRVLEVGAGTGINAPLYPRDCQVTAIDLSSAMLEKARERVSRLGLAWSYDTGVPGVNAIVSVNVVRPALFCNSTVTVAGCDAIS